MNFNETKIWKTLAILFFILLLISILSNSLNFIRPKQFSTDFNNILEMQEIFSIIKNNYYIEPPSNEILLSGAKKGIVSSLNDPYSDYYNKDELKKRMESLSGEFGGIGAWVGERDGKIYILKPIPGYPAAKAGILPMDEIIEIDGKNIEGLSLDAVVGMLRGTPGKEVQISIKREGVNELIRFNIVREVIKIEFVKSDVLNKNIGFIKIEQFGERSSEDFKKHLENLLNKNIKGLIIDLRGNPGGYLYEVINILDYFFDDELLLYTKGRNKNLEEKYTGNKGVLVDKKFPIIVLIDNGSASASEIFAAVMKDYKRALILGVKSFGKGVVQQIFYLRDGGALFLTISQYFTPGNYPIHKQGVSPDIEIKGIEFTDQEKTIVSRILQDGYIKKFVKEYGKNYSTQDFENLKKELNSKGLKLSDYLLRYLIFNQININNVDMFYNLDFDPQLIRAIEEMKKLIK
ncbi:MAG: S41 family peptidase [Spirochaetes bacterium]|nr:S41 family peptidase [Spirochaetota bacterium]